MQKTVNVETTNARATTTLQDTTPTVPLPDAPQGLMVLGPQVTLHFVEGEWNQANSYDYYDVVQVDGTSYIAVQDVPANTEITNTEYWAKWNDPNAQVELLQETVNSFDGRITTAQNTADTALTTANGKAPINHASAANTYGVGTSSQYGHLKITDDIVNQGASTGMAASAKSLYDYANRDRRHVVVIGDSFSDTDSRAYAWPSKLTEFTVHNFAKSGAGFVDVSATSSTFKVQLDNAIASSDFDNDDVCAVIVYGGINDFLHGAQAASVANVMNAMYSDIIENFINAKPIFAVLNAPNTLTTTRWTYKEVCEYQDDLIRAGNQFPKLIANYILTPYTPASVYSEDGIHPNESGMNVIAGFMRAAIYGTETRQRIDEYDDQLSVVKTLDYFGNFSMHGVIAVSNLTTGDNTVNFGGNAGQYKPFYDINVIPVPYACSNTDVTSVYLAPTTGLLHVTCRAAVSSTNIYL